MKDHANDAPLPSEQRANGDSVSEFIRVVGAREHNLRDVSLQLPKGKLICLTGVSGSGKSSLAFDTLYAEGQRRYIESLSSYARQFMGELPKPDVDQITGLSPSISIQQKASGWNPRSTVGTITQIHDYIRVLYARAGDAHCPQCQRPITAQTREEMLAQVLALPAGTRIMLLAPRIRGQKGEHRELFEELLRRGFIRARVDGEVCELTSAPALDRYRRHDIEVVVDRLVVRPENRTRIADSLELALQEGQEAAIVAIETASIPQRRAKLPSPAAADDESAVASTNAEEPAATPSSRDLLLSAGYACTNCKLSFEPPSPQLFSFNSPQGMCPDCDGLGTRFDFDPDLLVPDKSKSFLAPCIAAFRTKIGRWPRHIYEGVARHLGVKLDTPWRDLPPSARHALLYGTGDAHITFEWRNGRIVWKHGGKFEGVIAELQARYKRAASGMVREFYEQFMRSAVCPRCRGARLSAQALAVTLRGRPHGQDGAADDLNIQQVCALPIDQAQNFFSSMELTGVRRLIAEEPLKEIRARLGFLLDVGLSYLSLDRAAPTLSGGESQRIRLASQIGAGLHGVLYVLDEPSIGLHPRDNQRLLQSLLRLRDQGNTVVVVEHDRDTMEAADYIVDFGPGAGVRGGRITACGTLEEVSRADESITGAYLSGRRSIETPAARRPVPNPPSASDSDPSAVAKKSSATRARTRRPSTAGENR